MCAPPLPRCKCALKAVELVNAPATSCTLTSGSVNQHGHGTLAVTRGRSGNARLSATGPLLAKVCLRAALTSMLYHTQSQLTPYYYYIGSCQNRFTKGCMTSKQQTEPSHSTEFSQRERILGTALHHTNNPHVVA